MSDNDFKELKAWIEENLAKSFIRALSLSAASPIIIVRRLGSAPKVCIDYHALNDITIKDRHPSLRIEETFNQIRGAKYFTKIDLRRYFHQIRIQEGDEWKTIFQSRYGLFEFLVMPFGLMNAPATAQRFMNDTLREYLDLFCVVYIDNILIYSNNKREHREQVQKVLAKLKEAELYAKPEKCEFSVEKITFLGFVISAVGIKMDLAKVEAIHNWGAPKYVMDVQCFLGFANFHRRFIHRYSEMCQPLFELLKKDTPFIWSPQCETVFKELKIAFTSTPILY